MNSFQPLGIWRGGEPRNESKSQTGCGMTFGGLHGSDAETGRKLMAEALRRLELLTIEQVHKAYSEWRLVDMLAQTRLTPDLLIAVMETIARNGWQKADILAKIKKMMLVLENRNRKVAQKWVEVME